MLLHEYYSYNVCSLFLHGIGTRRVSLGPHRHPAKRSLGPQRILCYQKPCIQIHITHTRAHARTLPYTLMHEYIEVNMG